MLSCCNFLRCVRGILSRRSWRFACGGDCRLRWEMIAKDTRLDNSGPSAILQVCDHASRGRRNSAYSTMLVTTQIHRSELRSTNEAGISTLLFEGHPVSTKSRVAELSSACSAAGGTTATRYTELITQPQPAKNTKTRSRTIVRRSHGGQFSGRRIIPMTNRRIDRNTDNSSNNVTALRRNLAAKVTPDEIRDELNSLRNWRRNGMRSRAPLVARQSLTSQKGARSF
jgi:hypothetical protein